MNYLQIYNQLFADRTLQMQFATALDAESFRVALHKFKKKQDKILLATGIMEVAPTLSYKVTPVSTEDLIDGSGGYWEATFKFTEKKAVKEYSVKILDENE